MSHTSGPWEWVHAGNSGGRYLATYGGIVLYSPGKAPNEANARLIASAPDLLALLQRLETWDHMQSAGDGPYWLREIRAAIAKATGDTP